MGDGSLSREPSTARLDVSMTTPEYLEYLDDIFGYLSRGVSVKDTSTERAIRDRQNEFNPNAEADNYQDIYRWYTSCHPAFDKFRAWYESGKKVWPEDIDLTPTVLRHLYSGDGSLHKDNQVRISMPNEKGNEKKVERYFERAGLPTPLDWYGEGENHHSALWSPTDSEILFDYMGEPVVGFKYKWPKQ